MSIINSFCLLLLLLLLLSLHASDARSLRNHTSREVDQRSNSKENEKLDATRVSNEADQKANHILPNNGTEDIAKDLDNEQRAVVDEAKKDDGETAVAWKVPHHKKGGQPEPGFNLDYLPPKTHPPVHN